MAQNDKKTWLLRNTKINEILRALRQANSLLGIRVAKYSLPMANNGAFFYLIGKKSV